VIEFEPSGNILDANENFLDVMGYTLEEIKGRHHRIFVDPKEHDSREYREFWASLNRGEYQAEQYRRIAKDGRSVWIQASYNPVLDASGAVVRVVKFATDVTEERRRNANYEGQIAAIGKSQAVIEFEMDGTIRGANENFLNTLGYSKGEIEGRHHRMFVDPSEWDSPEYARFWEKLGRGEFQAGEFRRVAKDGSPVYIQATYNPILDEEGRPVKVVKYATDVTARVAAVAETREVLGKLADGDLTASIQGEFSGDFASLRESINGTMTKLRDLVASILQATDSITGASSEIAKGNADLSQRTEEQASSLEETASTIEELTGTVKQNADNAAQANQLAQDAREQAEKGGNVVRDAVTAMGEINASSKKISDIIGVIDEIAFQTNLLALNAAVEAARAGEQGRGFAVVAAEVRSLAQRSADAAKEIKSLINDSVTKVQDGSKLVDESGETLDQIVTAVGKVSDIISEIAAASAEQSSGIDQVNKAVSQLDEVTQQNASLVEEAAAASKTLDEQAQGLCQSMSFFTTGSTRTTQPAAADGGGAPPRMPAAVRPKAPASRGSAAGPDGDDWEDF